MKNLLSKKHCKKWGGTPKSTYVGLSPSEDICNHSGCCCGKEEKEFDKEFPCEDICNHSGCCCGNEEIKNFISKVRQETAMKMILPNVNTDPKEYEAVERYRRSQKEVLNNLLTQ